MKHSQLLAVATLFILLHAIKVKAQTNIPLNTVVTQNFNAIGASSTASLPANWKMSSAGTGLTSGWATGTNIIATTQTASTGVPTTGGAYNWATTAGTDRAVGFMASGGYASPNSIMAYFRNTTGATITTLTINFAIERYRINTAAFSLAFFSSADGAAWTARTDGDIGTTVFATAASAYSFGSPQIVFKTVTLTGLTILNNGDFYLRWIFTNTGSSNSQGLGLDNVSLFAGTATPFIVAQLRDALTIDNPPLNQANPGDQLTYTTVIKNTGTGDANGVILTNPAPTNTTFVPGSAKTSSLAKDESFSTAFNTALTGNNVLTNDFGLPSPAVLSFGPTGNAAATVAGGSGVSDNGGTVIVNSNGTFTYTPLAGFTGTDKFSYIAGNGNLPNNDAIVTISVGSAAVASNESYSIVGNVSILPNAAAGVLANDGGNGITITAVNGSVANVATPITTAGGGNLTVNADGSFTYNPLAGFEGSDNFTYSIDNGFASPQTATVTLNISGMVWFINAAAAAGGNGRISTPFNTIAAYNAAAGANPPSVNDNIFVYENAAAYTGSFTLLNGQRLIGQDATATLSTITGLTPNATYSTAFPAMNTGAPVTILSTTVAATNAVNLNSVAGTNLLRGFTLGNTTGSGISGSGFGTLTISDISKNGTGQALALTSGAFGATAIIDNITTTNSVNAVSLTTITGTLTITTGAISGATGTAFNVSGGTVNITYSGGITQANNAAMVSIAGGHITGTITFNTGTLSATNGTGLQFDNADGAYNFNGTTTLNGGDAGIDILNGSAGTFTFTTGTTITNPSGIAFNIGGTANTAAVTYNGSISKNNAGSMVSITNHATGTILFQTGTLSATTATTGNGLQFDNADGTYSFNGTTTLNGGDAGIDILNGSAGTFSFGNGTAITSPSGVAFNIGGTASTCAITYSGNITHATNTAMVSISGGHATGTVTFQTGTLSATNGTGLQFDNADGVYNFNGTTTLNGGDAGIDIINGSAGNFTFTNAPITNPSGVAFLVNGGNSTINHTGIISKTSAGRLIDIQSRSGGSVNINSNLSATTSSTGINVSACTGGTVTFAGATKTMNTPAVNPVTLATNTGATINFTGGGLVITSTTATGFNATGGGSINVTGTGNIITSTTGTALNVVSTSFGGSGATFQSISSSGGANGILLNSSSGNLTVTGDGSGFANGSGGSLSNITGGVLGNAPVYMLTASGIITLRSMNMSLNTNCYSGMLVDNNASGNVTVNVTGCTFIGVTTSVVQNKSLLQFEAGGAANVTANVQNSYFSSNRTYGVFATGAGTSILNVTINQCGFGTDINAGSPVNNPGTTITNPPPFSVGVTNGSSSQVNYLISNNTFWGADGLLGAIYAVTISGASTTASSRLIGTFSGNKIGKTGVTGSGAANNSGGLGLLPGTGGIFQATVINNDIRQVNALGINFKNSVTGAAGTSNVKIKGNTIAEPDPTGAPLFQRAIIVDPGNSGGASMTACTEIGGILGGEPNIISGAWQVGNFIRVTNNNNTVALRLPGLIPSAGATAAQVNAFVQSNNTMAASSVNTSLGTTGIVGGAVCF